MGRVDERDGVWCCGWWGRVSQQPEVGYTCHLDTGSNSMSSISNRNRHNPQDTYAETIVGCSFVTTPLPIYAVHWLHRSCSTPTQLDRFSEKPSVKADLAIYSHRLGVSGQCQCVALKLSFNLDFSSFAIMDSYRKSSHIHRKLAIVGITIEYVI